MLSERHHHPPTGLQLAGCGSCPQILTALQAASEALRRAGREADRGNTFPLDGVKALRDAGALAHFGAADPDPLELMEALRIVGRADLSLGRIFEGHVNACSLIRWYGTLAQRRRLGGSLSAGEVYGVWNTEQPPGVRLWLTAGEPVRLVGAKTFATGAGFIDWAIVTARPEVGEPVMVLAPAADPVRARPETWRVRGMRGTVSGAYDLTGLPATDDRLLGAPGDFAREPRLSAGAWRFAAVQLGGIERVVTLLRDQLAATTDPDPIHRARFGEAVAECRSAYLWVREAAARAGDPLAQDDAAAFVRLCRGVVERAALRCMEAATRCVGTKTFFEDHPLDQACRDLGLYLRQPAPDQAADSAARDFLIRDRWTGDRLW
jgi:alkylation response protein AidB-like acyl-CoA dehydrogenase